LSLTIAVIMCFSVERDVSDKKRSCSVGFLNTSRMLITAHVREKNLAPAPMPFPWISVTFLGVLVASKCRLDVSKRRGKYACSLDLCELPAKHLRKSALSPTTNLALMVQLIVGIATSVTITARIFRVSPVGRECLHSPTILSSTIASSLTQRKSKSVSMEEN
jgi:hypothetical protein